MHDILLPAFFFHVFSGSTLSENKCLIYLDYLYTHSFMQNCRALCKAYEMNPFIHFPVYSLAVPLLLVYTIHKTSRIWVASRAIKRFVIVVFYSFYNTATYRKIQNIYLTNLDWNDCPGYHFTVTGTTKTKQTLFLLFHDRLNLSNAFLVIGDQIKWCCQNLFYKELIILKVIFINRVKHLFSSFLALLAGFEDVVKIKWCHKINFTRCNKGVIQWRKSNSFFMENAICIRFFLTCSYKK